jgi:hypothetical protein
VAERVIFGSSVAALVAADALAAAGDDVRLLAPEKSLGGGFGSMHQGERILELGVRLLELSYEDTGPTPSFDRYLPGPAGHRPFAAVVRQYVEDLVRPRLRQVRRPQMFFGGRTVDDLYFTTDALAVRDAVDDATRAIVHTEARAAADAIGAAGLLAPDRAAELDQLDLAAASRRSHGPTFHALFMEPMAEKFTAGGCAGIVPALRRKIWLPLFWPLTLTQAAGTGPVEFAPDRPFHTIKDGGTGELITALLARIAGRGLTVTPCAPLAQIRRGPHGRSTLELADGTSIEATRPIVGVAAAALFSATDIDYQAEPARTVISWLEVADSDLLDLPALLNIVDADIPAVRISTGGRGRAGHQILTVELRHDLHEAEIAAAARKSVERVGFVRAGAELAEVRSGAMRTFALPTQANANRFDLAATQLAELDLDLEIVGAGLGLGADALGEQIIQGLRAAERLSA